MDAPKTNDDHIATGSSESSSSPSVIVDDQLLLQDIGTDDDDLEQQQTTTDPQQPQDSSYAMELGEWNRDWQQQEQQHDEHNNANNTTDGKAPPERKMTGASDATSITASSSFLDDDSSFCEGLKPTGSNSNMTVGKKPRLDSLDELPEALEGGDADGDSDGTTSTTAEDSRGWLWFKRFLLFLVIFGSVAFFSVLIGAAVEKRNFANAAGTSHYYNQMPQVCGVTDPKTDAWPTTMDSVEQAHNAGLQIAHCGECGHCSTAHDMKIMTTTADSLTGDSTRCAFKIFVGRRAVQKCMAERVGFTTPCEDCWLDNISCSFRSCKFTCIKYKLFRQDNNNNGGDELNDCLKCDERMCGPGFIECSGSNRRRMGIVSDIGRDADNEQCQSVDVDWNNLYNVE